MQKARGGESKKGEYFPFRQRVLGVLPQYFFFNLSAPMCVFNVLCVFTRLGPDFSRFGHDFLLEKIFLGS